LVEHDGAAISDTFPIEHSDVAANDAALDAMQQNRLTQQQFDACSWKQPAIGLDKRSARGHVNDFCGAPWPQAPVRHRSMVNSRQARPCAALGTRRVLLCTMPFLVFVYGVRHLPS
jgi:hypothetical protein